MSVLSLQNRQRTRKIDLRFLRRITRYLLENLLEETDYELGFHFVGTEEMANVNQTFLQHEGSTDVITFDHRDSEKSGGLHGEIFICIDDAISQAKQFKTTWQSELVRYVTHGVLHLEGYDDLQPELRRKMKAAENRLVTALSREFSFAELERRSRA